MEKIPFVHLILKSSTLFYSLSSCIAILLVNPSFAHNSSGTDDE